jgi:hypothetical protein
MCRGGVHALADVDHSKGVRLSRELRSDEITTPTLAL